MRINQPKIDGFSLLELMIVVAVVGILAAIAYPSYIDSVRKSKRADAQVAVMELARKLEVYYSRNAGYSDDLSKLGYGNAGWNDVKDSSGNTTYRVKVAATSDNCPIASCYKIVAQSRNNQVNDDIEKYRLWSTGRKQKMLAGGWTNGWTM